MGGKLLRFATSLTHYTSLRVGASGAISLTSLKAFGFIVMRAPDTKAVITSAPALNVARKLLGQGAPSEAMQGTQAIR